MLGAVPAHRRRLWLSHWLLVQLYSLKLVKVGKSSFNRRDFSDVSTPVSVPEV